MRYLIPKEVAEKWGIPVRRVQILCKQGKIKGAECHGRIWLIPETAEKPEDAFSLPKVPCAIVPRPRLTEKIAPPGSSLTYIHADAGYGKTTLMMQYAGERNDVVWLSLDERDSNMTYFLRHLEDAFRKKFPRFDFYATDLLPFAARDTFVSRALSALLCAIGRRKLTLILDDVHVITNGATMDFLNRLVKSCPSSLTLVMAGRYELWSGLFRLKMEGRIVELTKADLCFSREEAQKLWGFFDEAAYTATEGWALVLQSYWVAAENGKLCLPQADRKLYSYLMEFPWRRAAVCSTAFCLCRRMLLWKIGTW